MKKKIYLGMLVILLCSLVLGLTLPLGTQLRPSSSNTIYELGNNFLGSNVTVNSTHIGLDDRFIRVESGELLVNITEFKNRTSRYRDIYFKLNDTGNFDYDSSGLNENMLLYVNGVYNFGNNFTTESTNDVIQLRESNKTSYLGIGIDIPDVVVSSTEYVLISSVKFNTSALNSDFGLIVSTNLEKIISGSPSDAYLNITIDGLVLYEGLIRTLDNKGQPGVPAIPPMFFSVSNSEHTLNFYGKKTGNGAVRYYNTDVSLGDFRTPSEIEGRGNLTSVNTVYNSITPVEVFSKEIKKSFDSSTYVSLQLSINSDSDLDVICKMQDGGYSPYFVVSMIAGSTRGVSTSYITEPELLNINLSIMCFSTDTGVVTMNGSFIEADMVDYEGNIINHNSKSNPSTNYTNTRVLNTGTHLITSVDHVMVGGRNLFLSGSISARSNSGASEILYFMNVSGGVNASSCYSEKERYHSNNGAGNIFFYTVCDGLKIDDSYNISLFATVPTGEVLEILDESLVLFENDNFDISSQNTPPRVRILSPANGSLISNYIFDINVSGSDSQNDSLLVNISIGDLIVLNNSPFYVGNYSIDWSDLGINGLQNLTITVFENETSDLYSGFYDLELNFYVDLTAPSGEFGSSSTIGTLDASKIIVNASVTDDFSLKNITFNLYDSNSLFISSNSINVSGVSNSYVNTFNNLEYGTYYVDFIVYDSAGNNFTIDKRKIYLVRDTVERPSEGSSGSSSVGDIELNTTVTVSNETINITLPLSFVDKIFSKIKEKSNSEILPFLSEPIYNKYPRVKNYMIIVLISVLILLYLLYNFVLVTLSDLFGIAFLWFILTIVINLVILGIIYLFQVIV